MTEEQKCKARIGEHYASRMSDLRQLLKAEHEGNEDGVEGLGVLNEYGLCFDYVAPATFKGQRLGYFRYQLSWGGPSDEFRFFVDERFIPYKVEYWFLDWFDGAKRTLRSGKAFDFLASDLWDFLMCGDPKFTASEMIRKEAE